MKNKVIVISIVIVVLLALAGNTHHFLPESNDPCQQDMSHQNHISELAMFHCIGHTEYVVAAGKKDLQRVAKWDHLHSWMTLEWHIKQGFSQSHAVELIALSSKEL